MTGILVDTCFVFGSVRLDQMYDKAAPSDAPPPSSPATARAPFPVLREGPLLNYTLSTECPGCGAPTIRRACKVRCDRCGFMWDCSEL